MATKILWVLQHEWPSGLRFSFNCVCHWETLVIREGDGTGHFLSIKEGVSQGDPLAKIIYGLGIPPLSDISGRPTPALLIHIMLMTPGREALSMALASNWITLC